MKQIPVLFMLSLYILFKCSNVFYEKYIPVLDSQYTESMGKAGPFSQYYIFTITDTSLRTIKSSGCINKPENLFLFSYFKFFCKLLVNVKAMYIYLGYSKTAVEPFTEVLIQTFMKDSVEETDISMVGLEIGGGIQMYQKIIFFNIFISKFYLRSCV